MTALGFDVALASGVSLALGLARIGAPSFWVDEAFTARATTYAFTNLPNEYHWLYYTLIKTWSLLAGSSETALRLPSVFGSMLAAGLLVTLASRLFDRRVALTSGLLLATSPFVVKWSQQARGYTLLIVLALIATLILMRALERDIWAVWLSYGVAYSLVFVWHPLAALTLFPAHLALLLQRRERLGRTWLLAAGVGLVMCAPWLVVNVEREASGEGATSWIPPASTEVVARSLLEVSGAAGVGLALALAGVWALRRAGKLDLGVWLGLWAFSPFAIALAISTVEPVFLDRYLIVATPAFALLAGVGLASLAPRLALAAGAAAVLATGLALTVWYSLGARDNWRGENWSAAAEFVRDRDPTGRAMVLPEWASFAATYYGLRAVERPSSRSIWVLYWSETGHDVSDEWRVASGLGPYRLAESLQFGWRVRAQLWKRH